MFAVLAAQIRLYDLVHCRLDQGRFPPASDGTTITALAFSGGGSTLAAATAGGHLLVYQVQSCPSPFPGRVTGSNHQILCRHHA